MQAPAKDTDRYFEAIEEGETYTIEDARTITEADVVDFAGISGDFHPLHVSAAHAAEASFGERIAHGNLVFSIAAGLIADLNPKAFAYGYDDLRFVKPVFLGTTITVHREVVETAVHNDDLGRVVYEYTVEGDEGETLIVCKHITLCERRDASN